MRRLILVYPGAFLPLLSPPPCSTKPLLALFDHHPSAHLPDVKEPCLPFTTSRFGVQFHSQNNHDGLFWKVSLTFIKHGDADLSLLPPPDLRVDVCKGYNPSIQSTVKYFYSLLLTDGKHPTFSYMNLKCAESQRQGCQVHGRALSRLLCCQSTHQPSVTLCGSQLIPDKAPKPLSRLSRQPPSIRQGCHLG